MIQRCDNGMSYECENGYDSDFVLRWVHCDERIFGFCGFSVGCSLRCTTPVLLLLHDSRDMLMVLNLDLLRASVDCHTTKLRGNIRHATDRLLALVPKTLNRR